MRLPCDLAGADLVRLLARYDYEVTRQTGSHLRLTSRVTGVEHHVTMPNASGLRVGTLARIVAEVAEYVGRDREEIAAELFEG